MEYLLAAFLGMRSDFCVNSLITRVTCHESSCNSHKKNVAVSQQRCVYGNKDGRRSSAAFMAVKMAAVSRIIFRVVDQQMKKVQLTATAFSGALTSDPVLFGCRIEPGVVGRDVFYCPAPGVT